MRGKWMSEAVLLRDSVIISLHPYCYRGCAVQSYRHYNATHSLRMLSDSEATAMGA